MTVDGNHGPDPSRSKVACGIKCLRRKFYKRIFFPAGVKTGKRIRVEFFSAKVTFTLFKTEKCPQCPEKHFGIAARRSLLYAYCRFMQEFVYSAFKSPF